MITFVPWRVYFVAYRRIFDLREAHDTSTSDQNYRLQYLVSALEPMKFLFDSILVLEIQLRNFA